MNEFMKLFLEGFRWLACNANGELYAYYTRPIQLRGTWDVKAGSDVKQIDNIYTITYTDGPLEIEKAMHMNVYPTLLKENTTHTKTTTNNNKHDGHYKTLEIEPWDIMRADFTKEELKGFFKGNILKYLLRNKEGVKDIDKLINYAQELKQLLESEVK